MSTTVKVDFRRLRKGIEASVEWDREACRHPGGGAAHSFASPRRGCSHAFGVIRRTTRAPATGTVGRAGFGRLGTLTCRVAATPVHSRRHRFSWRRREDGRPRTQRSHSRLWTTARGDLSRRKRRNRSGHETPVRRGTTPGSPTGVSRRAGAPRPGVPTWSPARRRHTFLRQAPGDVVEDQGRALGGNPRRPGHPIARSTPAQVTGSRDEKQRVAPFRSVGDRTDPPARDRRSVSGQTVAGRTCGIPTERPSTRGVVVDHGRTGAGRAAVPAGAAGRRR